MGDKVYCPIVGQEIELMECYDAALVFEEISPTSELPSPMTFTSENQKICMNCDNHHE